MSIAEGIKSALSMRDVAEMYGFSPDRAGRIVCPFHDDHKPSLKIYEEPGRGFWCYACNNGGSVIDFVINLFGIPFSAACVRLNADFRLGLTQAKPNPREAQERARALRIARETRERTEREYLAICDRHRRLWRAKFDKRPVSPGDEFDPEYIEACLYLERVAQWLDDNTYR
jgi:DNA primase